jgi:hypothetical protein
MQPVDTLYKQFRKLIVFKNRLIMMAILLIVVTLILNRDNKAFVRDVGIIDMHIGDMLWTVSGQYLDILSSLVTLISQILT